MVESLFGRPFVKRFAMLSVRCPICPVCLSVTFVHYGQTVGRIKMKLATLENCVKWGPSSPSPKGAQPPIFGPCLLRPNGWMDEAGTWQGRRPQPRGLCVRWRPSLPPQQRGRSPLPIFGPFLLCPNGWMHQDATRYGGRPQPRRVCVRCGPSPLPKRGAELLHNFKG